MKNLKSLIHHLSDREQKETRNKCHGVKTPFLLGSESKGVSNLTLVSNVFHIGASPHLIGILFRPDNVERHGLTNIRKSKRFSLNSCSVDFIEKVHQTSARYDKNISEFETCGLEKGYAFEIPYIPSAQMAIFLDLESEVKIETNGTHLIIGRVQEILIKDELICNDKIDFSKIYDHAVVGLNEYVRTEKLFSLSYAKPNQECKKV